MGGRWDDKANLKFVSLYEQHQCLWKTDSSSYKNRDVRERAINRVVGAMGIPEFRNLDCKNKIKNVRSHYIQELKKIRKSRRLSPSGEPTYEPKLAWFAALDRFLRPHILTLTKAGGTNRRIPANFEGDGGEGGKVWEEDADTAAEAAQDTTMSAIWFDESPDGTNEMHGVVENPQTTTAATRNVFLDADDQDLEEEEDRKPPRKSRAEGPQPPAPPSGRGPDLIVDGQTVNVTPVQKDSEFEAFGRSIAAQLKNMPFSVALQLQLKIQTLITEERLRMLRSPPD